MASSNRDSLLTAVHAGKLQGQALVMISDFQVHGHPVGPHAKHEETNLIMPDA